MAPTSFHLEPKSFTPPTKTRPLRVSFVSSTGRKTNPMYPATLLRLSYRFVDDRYDEDHVDYGMEIFSPEVIVPREVTLVERHDNDHNNNASDSEDGGSGSSDEGAAAAATTTLPLYAFEVPRDQVPCVPICKPETAPAEVTLYAWRQDKFLGQWPLGQVKGLGHGVPKEAARRQPARQASQ
ncbi:hypothetical protein VFPFJ_00254 [Purpureocillium lilacinum]|uniref:Uncharacterized protein n=1 Tax=Purpureocillium lilacinum TaxID=33203 RepID=A0A179HUH8_PURLI|nr:hypothetical protein VFPFJ_00254 [Purpureocillium lilacinum]OAQ86187.1 hypothetical protein VFPBJ_00227 [Purpureocillium lilacinum]OAQ94145.1 hypothetical protein VFPFJ_00254 [Purpureocillium lilacinum]GJN67548.1 hypothetical protein PLICBS_001574 [Purpureocillium lilacinum]GJN81457.1 hypothetical protein PLIIFM63780_004991 [Purpureocillium lilacinum]